MKISIITVCYNAEATIGKTIQSVVEQTHPEIEYILVDGQSNDKTMDIINSYQNKISRIISEPDKGIYDAMNKGIKAATGEYLLFLNADDYLISETIIKNICDLLVDDRRTDIFFGNVIIYDRTTGKGGLWEPRKLSNTLLYRSTIPHPATFFNQRVFKTIGMYNTENTIVSDYELIVKAFKQGCRFRYEKCLISVFNNGGISTTESNSKTVKRERDLIIKKYFSKPERIYLKIRVRIQKIFNI